MLEPRAPRNRSAENPRTIHSDRGGTKQLCERNHQTRRGADGYRPPVTPHAAPRYLRLARSLALGSTLAALACERRTDDTPTQFATSGSANEPAQDAQTTSVDPAQPVQPVQPPQQALVSVQDGQQCMIVGSRAEITTGRGLIPCQCVANAQRSAEWRCDPGAMVIEGPLPPPELRA